MPNNNLLVVVTTVKCFVRHSFQSHQLLHRYLLPVNKFCRQTAPPCALTCWRSVHNIETWNWHALCHHFHIHDNSEHRWRRSQGCTWQHCQVVLTESLLLIVCLFVCWNKTPKTILSLRSKPPGSDHTRAEAQATCVLKTAVHTTYLSNYAWHSTSWRAGCHLWTYDKDYTCRILSHRTASPHALFDVLVMDEERGKTVNDCGG